MRILHLSFYQAKRKKVFLMSSTDQYSTLKTEDSNSKFPDSIEFYNATVYGTDIRDQMHWKYFTKYVSRESLYIPGDQEIT